MDLFEIVNNRVKPTIHALLIEPFKSMWENDTSEFKQNCIKDFTYVELMCNPRKSNIFMGYPEQERPSKVKREVWGNEDHPITTEIMFAVMKYQELLNEATPSYGLYVSALNSIAKLRNFLDNFDPDERTRAGGLIMKPKDLTGALKELDDVSRSLEASKERVHSELVNNAKTRNEREIGRFER